MPTYRRVVEIHTGSYCDAEGAARAAAASELFLRALAAVRAVDAATIARASNDASQIAQRVHTARVAAVKAALTLTE